MKREIFLANFNIIAKSESISNLKNYLKQQEDSLENQIKYSTETNVLYRAFMKEEAQKLRKLKEHHLRLDEQKVILAENVSSLKNSIIGMDYNIKRMGEEIQVE